MPKKTRNRVLTGHLGRCTLCNNQNIVDGKHLCLNDEVEILNPEVTGETQALFIRMGLMSEGFEVPREYPKINPR